MAPATTTDVVYGRKHGMALVMDVHRPENPSGAGVLALSSGGWHSFPEAGKPDTAELLKRGMTAFVVMHGSRPRFGVTEIVDDVRRAVRFVRSGAATFGVDPDRLGLFAISSGGNVSLSTAARGGPGNPDADDPIDRVSDRVGAVACFYPPTDLLNYGEPGKVWVPYRPPGETAADEELARAWSPVTHFTADMPPTFIIHGDADTLVPVQQCYAARDRLRDLGVEHAIQIEPGKEHGWPDMSAEHAQCADWLETHLG